MSPVVEVVHLLLALFGQFKSQHVHGQVVLGLGLVKVLLINVVTGDSCCVGSQHDQRVIVNTEGADVMAALLAESRFVFVLKK